MREPVVAALDQPAALLVAATKMEAERNAGTLSEEVVRQPGPATLGIASQDARPHALLEEQRHGRRLEAAHLAEHVGQQFVAGHHGGLDECPAVRREPFHPPGHQVVGRGRNRAWRLDRIGEYLDELAGEEGMALGAAVHLNSPAIGRQDADRVNDQLEHLLLR